MLKITHPFGLFLPEFLNLPYLCLSDFGKQLCIVLPEVVFPASHTAFFLTGA